MPTDYFGGSFDDMPRPFDYSGKVVLITGTGSGFGVLASRKFSETGARLLLADVNEDAVNVLAPEQACARSQYPGIFSRGTA